MPPKKSPKTPVYKKEITQAEYLAECERLNQRIRHHQKEVRECKLWVKLLEKEKIPHQVDIQESRVVLAMHQRELRSYQSALRRLRKMRAARIPSVL